MLVRLGGKQKELHPFFLHPNLGDAMHFVVVKHPRAKRFEVGEFGRHVVMLEPILHVEKIVQRAGIGLHRVKLRRARGAGHDQ